MNLKEKRVIVPSRPDFGQAMEVTLAVMGQTCNKEYTQSHFKMELELPPRMDCLACLTCQIFGMLQLSRITSD